MGYGSAAGTGNVFNYYGDALMPTIDPNMARGIHARAGLPDA